MATNKTAIIAKIQAMLTGNAGVTSRSEHEEFLHTDAASIVEAIYGSSVTETHSSGTVTTSNANFNYEVTINKVGSLVTMNGSFTVNGAGGGFLPTTVIFALADSNYTAEANDFFGIAQKRNSDQESIAIGMDGVNLQLEQVAFGGEQFFFTINYRTLN